MSARDAWLVPALVAVVLVLPAASMAQSCFQGRPYPECRSFWIVDSGLNFRINEGSDRDVDATGLTLELGRARNRGTRTAWGATAFLRVGDTVSGFGVRARYRRWLGQRASVDIAPGIRILGLEDEPGHGGGAGFSGQIALNLPEWVGIGLQADQGQGRRGGTSKLYWYSGVRLGGWAGVAGYAVLAGLGVAAAATWE